jgi:hypothetical protein
MRCFVFCCPKDNEADGAAHLSELITILGLEKKKTPSLLRYYVKIA